VANLHLSVRGPAGSDRPAPRGDLGQARRIGMDGSWASQSSRRGDEAQLLVVECSYETEPVA